MAASDQLRGLNIWHVYHLSLYVILWCEGPCRAKWIETLTYMTNTCWQVPGKNGDERGELHYEAFMLQKATLLQENIICMTCQLCSSIRCVGAAVW